MDRENSKLYLWLGLIAAAGFVVFVGSLNLWAAG